jgi:hypothetical protein
MCYSDIEVSIKDLNQNFASLMEAQKAFVAAQRTLSDLLHEHVDANDPRVRAAREAKIYASRAESMARSLLYMNYRLGASLLYEMDSHRKPTETARRLHVAEDLLNGLLGPAGLNEQEVLDIAEREPSAVQYGLRLNEKLRKSVQVSNPPV